MKHNKNPYLFKFKTKTLNHTSNNEYASQSVLLKLKPKQKLASLYQLYQCHFEKQCYCSHDCCGHWFSNLVYAKRKGRNVTMKIAYARNY